MAVNTETFRLKLDGHEVPIAKDYTVHSGVMEVPAAFEMTVGHSGLVAELANAFPPYTPFELFVDDVKVATGETDGYTLSGSHASEITIRGRDLLKWLVDKRLDSDRTFAEKTFLQLTELALQEVGLGDATIVSSNTANRKAITGRVAVKEIAAPTTEGTTTEAGAVDAQRKVVYRTIRADVGTLWWDFLSEQYRRAGLFLWADVFGGFVLARPNGKQIPTYRIVRRRTGQNTTGDVTILGQPDFTFDTTNRYTECLVTGRAGGGKDGRGRVSGRHIDEEMVALLNRDEADRANGGKRKKELHLRDDKVRTRDQATFLARRKIAESKRNGWALSYTVAGHTAPALRGGGRAIWQPDTVVEVIDDELGIEGPMYVESLVYSRKPETTTRIRLMRCDDLLFAEEDFDSPPRLAVKKGVANVRVGKTEAFRVEAMWRTNPQWGGLPTQIRDAPTLKRLR